MQLRNATTGTAVSRLGGKRGAGVRGPGVWKTRGLVENAGYQFFRQNMNFPQ